MTADPLAPHANRVVRLAAKDPRALWALADIASNCRRAWTLVAWRQLLAELDACNETVADWRAIREL